MAWIESHQKLEKSGKVIDLARRLDINIYQAIGHLHAFWWWALDNAKDGDVSRFCHAIPSVTGWRQYVLEKHSQREEAFQSPDLIVSALISSGFIDEKDGKTTIHNWEEYTWRYFELVAINQRRKEFAKDRKRRERERKSNGHASVTLVSRQGVRDKPVHHTLPNHTLPNLTSKTPSISPPLTPVQKIVEGWKILRGIQKTDKAWDKAHYKEHVRAAEKLVELFSGDVKAALYCMETVFNNLEKAGYRDFTINAIVKNSDSYRQEWLERKEKVPS